MKGAIQNQIRGGTNGGRGSKGTNPQAPSLSHLHTYLTNPPPELAESVKRIKRNGGYQRLLSRLEYVPLGVRADVYVARRDGKLNGNLTQFTSDCIARRVWETIESVAASVWCSRREVRQ